MAKEQVQWALSGMTCAGCASSAHTIAAGLPGIENVQVRYASGSFKALVDWQSFDLNGLQKMLGDAGYVLSTDYQSPEQRIAANKRHLQNKKRELIFASLAALPLLVLGMLHLHYLPVIYIQGFLAAFLSFYTGRRIHKKAFQLIKHGSTNMDTLVSLGSLVAFLYSVFQLFFASHAHIYFESAGLIIYFILIGKFLEDRGKLQNANALVELVSLQPAEATREQDGIQERVSVDVLELDQLVRIQPSERVPVDGVVIEGESDIDESTFTGEPMPIDKRPGSKVYAGTLNGHGGLLIRVSSTGRSSALGGIIDSVMDAQGTTAPIEALTDRISKIFVPTILLLSLLVGLWWHFGSGSDHALLYAIDVLVIACPCALGLATPLAVVAATGIGSKNGVLIRNAAALQLAGELKFAVLDKTGTLTLGKPTVRSLQWNGAARSEVLGALSSRGTHPLNSAINTYLGATGGVDLKRFKAHPGKGVEGKIEGALWFLGSTRWYEELTGQKAPITEGTCSLLFNETTWVAKISFEDQIHPNAKEVIGLLKSRNITPILASGDAQTAVEEVANALGIETYFGELQPSDKLEVLRKYAAQGRTMMVGDGINDTIALSTADVGVSLAHGTAAAQESAEVVLSREGLPQMKTYFALSTLTMKTIKGNLRWAFGYNIVAIPIAAGVLASPYGIELTPMMASIAMSFSSLGVVANSLRMHNKSL